MAKKLIPKEEVLRWVNLSLRARGLVEIDIYPDTEQFSTDLKKMLAAKSFFPDKPYCAPFYVVFSTKKAAKAVARAWNMGRYDERTVRLPLELQVFIAEVNAGRWALRE